MEWKFFKTLDILRQAFGQYRWHISALIILGVLSGMLESFGVTALIPLFSLIVQNGTESNDFFSRTVVQVFTYLPFSYSLKSLLALIVSLFLFRAVVIVVFNYLRARIYTSYMIRTMDELLRKIFKASWPYLLRQKLGYAELTLTRDVRQGSDLLKVLGQAILVFTSLVIYIAVAVKISLPIALITAFAGGIFLVLLGPLRKAIKAVGAETAPLEKEISYFLNEYTLGIKAVKSAAVEKEVFRKGIGYFRDFKRLLVRSMVIQSLGISAIQPLSIIFISGVFLFWYARSDFKLGAFLALIYLIQKIFVYIEAGQGALHSINEKIPYVENVINFKEALSQNVEEKEKGIAFDFFSRIVFKNINFSYDLRLPILRDVNFTLERGKTLGLIGPSGAGKTSLADLLLRLFVPSSGEILIDGVNIGKVDLGEWRRKIGYVSQDMFLLNDTIENNIRFYNPLLTAEKARQAARLANIYDFAMSLPAGFDTVVGERGIMLSAGQRQRVVLARILAREPEILIMDEATSALDNESELLIEKAIRALRGKITVFIIAHRLSTVMNTDRILALDNGTIMEEGEPAELLKNKESYFYRMYNIKEEHKKMISNK